MKLPFESALPFMIAAIRETFEESGIWLGTGSIPDSLREPLARSDVSLVDLVNQYSATLNLDALRAWSWWVTPAIEPRRYDTRFFVARTTSAVGQHDDQETVDSRWVDPRDAIARATAETFPLAPPTWWTLKELAAFDTVDEAFDAALHKEQRPIQPILAPDVEGAWMLKLPGHPDHPEPPMANLPTAVRFSQGRWWASQ